LAGRDFGVHRETVVLAGDADPPGIEVLDRVVRAMVAELHLEGPCARGQGQDLVPQADAEGRQMPASISSRVAAIA
jgi:hypothetical protein